MNERPFLNSKTVKLLLTDKRMPGLQFIINYYANYVVNVFTWTIKYFYQLEILSHNTCLKYHN